MEINPAETPYKSMKKLINGSVIPRPIAWVSSVNTKGQMNLAPFSYFNVVCIKPPTLLFCPGVRGTDGSDKDTLNNVRQTGEFVINLVTEPLAEAMNITATELPADVDEFELANLTPSSSKRVKPPRVKESPVNYECKLTEIIQVGDGSKGSGFVVLGEIVHMHIADDVMLPGYKINITELKPVSRLAGSNYATITDTFEMIRPPSQIKRTMLYVNVSNQL